MRRVPAGISGFFAVGVLIGMCVLVVLPTTVPLTAAVVVAALLGGVGAWLFVATGVAILRYLSAGEPQDANRGDVADGEGR